MIWKDIFQERMAKSWGNEESEDILCKAHLCVSEVVEVLGNIWKIYSSWTMSLIQAFAATHCESGVYADALSSTSTHSGLL